MARRVNPDLLGYDVVELLEEGVGAGAVAMANDKFVSPMVRNMVPGLYGSEPVAKAVDAATTAGTAWGLGKIIGKMDRTIGRRIERGGALLAIIKGFSILVPGLSLNASLPTSLAFNNPFAQVKAAETKALPAGNGAAAAAASAARTAIASTGL